MSWHYQVRRRLINGDPWYGLVEKYQRHGYTTSDMTPGSETRKGLIETLEMMLRDAKRYRTIVEKK